MSILKGFLASDTETQELIFLTGQSEGLIDKKIIEAVINDLERTRRARAVGIENLKKSEKV